MEKFKTVSNDQLFLLPPSIEDFIPADHLARVINEVVETIDVSEIEVKYSFLGQKSYHPHLLLKLLFYGYSIGVRSGRRIASACEQDTAFMYLASMYKPDFRTINDFRKDNVEFIKKAFMHIVQLCKQLGMCRTGMLIIDSTKLKANAAPYRSRTKEGHEQWLERIDTDIKAMLDEAQQNDKKEDEEYGNKRGDELPKEICSKQKLKEKLKKLLNEMGDDKGKRNPTDPEARFIKGRQGLGLNYSCQTAISEDGVIVSAYTNNCASDRTSTIPSVNDAESITKQVYTEILADSGYATFDNYEELYNRNKIIYIPDQQMNAEKEAQQQNPYHRNNFIFNKEKNFFTCPEGSEVTFSRNEVNKITKQQSTIYACKDCPACDKKAICTKGKYRQIHVEKRDHIRQEVRERLKSAIGKKIYLKRMQIESVFGNFKQNLNYKFLNLRGIKKTTAEWQLICIGHNLKKIHQVKMA